MNSKRIISIVVCLLVLTGSIHFTGLAAEQTTSGGYKVEAEDAEVVNANGNAISGTIQEDSAASGGKIQGSTNGKGYIYKNVPQSNSITMRYASTNTSAATVYIEKDGVFEAVGTISFSTTQSWEMKKAWNAKTDLLYIPENSTIKIVPAADVNIDYFVFETKALYKEKDLGADIRLASKTELQNASAVDDIYAYTGKAVELKKDGKAIFTIPDGVNCNIVNIRGSGKGITLNIVSDSGSAKVQFDSEIGDYKSIGVQISESKAPGKITVEIDTSSSGGVFHLDFVRMNATKIAETVTIGSNTYQPENGGRSEISLDGIWNCDSSPFRSSSDLTQTVPENITFNNSIAVPGLWDLADISMGDFQDQAMWYKKTVVFENAPDYQVILKIDRAYYGRYIYVNGKFVDDYQYNYSNSFTDISKYLVQGENEIVIMLGNSLQQINDPKCPAHVLSDTEKQYDYPGIVDHVSLILSGSPWVHSVQVAPDINNGSLTVQPIIKNNGESDLKANVEYKVYALGVLKDGKLQQDRKLVGTSSQQDQSFVSGGEGTVLNTVVTIDGFNESMLWTPESPYLFEIEVNTGSDVLVKRFGMRTFYFDSETKLPMLNGKVTYLRGTNVVMNRFFDDVNRKEHPWEEEWIRAFYAECKEVNWNSLRFHLGSAPGDWYDIADEMGYLIQDEYAWFSGCRDGCTEKTLRPEIEAWIDEKNTHPSIIIWDIQNEDISSGAPTITVKKNRDYDIQNRPWDNGWSKPLSDTDPFECHPYLLSAGFKFENLNDFSTSYENPDTIIKPGFAPNNPKILNEYGSIWLNREGDATTAGMQAYYDGVMANNTANDRISIYASSVGRISEFWRSGRHYAGLMQFCALTYSKPTGTAKSVTGDILMPDLSVPKFHPEIKETFRNAFAPLGIIIADWSETCERGVERKVPVTLVNDYNYDVNDLTVTLKVYKKDSNKVVEKMTQKVSLKAAGDAQNADRQEISFDLKVPGSNTDAFRVVAEYTLDGQTVHSERDWAITGGKITEIATWVIALISGGAAVVVISAAIITVTCVKKHNRKKAEIND